MHCFYGRGEINFPSTFTVQRVENRSSSHKISSIPILKLSSSLFESALSPFDLDRDSLPNETYLQFKEEKQHVPILFFPFFIEPREHFAGIARLDGSRVIAM